MISTIYSFTLSLLSELKLSDKLTMIGWIFTFIAFYIPWKTAYGKSISVEWQNTLEKIPISSLRLGEAQYKHPKNKYAYCTKIRIVNHSNVNIGYFDMCVFNHRTNDEHMLMMRDSILPEYKQQPLLLTGIGIDGNDYQIILNIPPNKTGIFPANSSIDFDLIITESPICLLKDTIFISFSVTYKKFFMLRIIEWFISWIKYIKPWMYSKIIHKKIFKPHLNAYKTFTKTYKLPQP